MEFIDKRPNTESRQPVETTGFLIRLVGQGTFEFDIVAESRYQDSLKELYGDGTHDGHTKKVEALLIYDYAYQHDDKAVSVSIDGKIVGFLDRTLARNFRARMNLLCSPGVPAVCEAMIVEGWDGNDGHFGVKLDLPQRSS
ncbi:MAG: hypothetical protein M3O07_02615 [Pseudomonadota bacterium]|nr:hypothetical protein [Pseudomonadota bacterium]